MNGKPPKQNLHILLEYKRVAIGTGVLYQSKDCTLFVVPKRVRKCP
jgi:hypothetical protein